jgi:hypothetical protein
MSFQPVIPAAGLAGWRFLERTYDAQYSAFQKAPELTRDSDYFAANIAKISSAEQLVSDRRLLRVALGAFGLESDINNRFFVQKILEEGSINTDSLANRLSDTRYKKFSAAFGFGPSEFTRTRLAVFAPDIASRFHQQEFEIAVGQQDDTMRIALFAKRELEQVATSDASVNAKWFTIMGQPPLRSMFETIFQLPSSVGQIDIDQQLGIFKDRAESVFGSSDIKQFSDPTNLDQAVTQYIARSQLQAYSAFSAGSIALTLLQSAAR